MTGLVGQWMQYPAYWDRFLSMIGIEVHWAILQYVLGLSLLAFLAYLIHLKTGNAKWERLAYTLFKGFVIVFAVGAATGTASEFGLVLLWPNLTMAAGRFIYFPLYAEVFAFILEIVAIYLTFYGWRRFGKHAMLLLLTLSFIGPWYSAAMIVSVNSYMVAPTGVVPAYDAVNGQWLYSEGYPKITLAAPDSLVAALNISALQAAGVTVEGSLGDALLVEMPSSIVQRIVYEAYKGYTVKDSILALVANQDYVKAHPEILGTPVMTVLDTILTKTMETVGVVTVTFQSPVYPATLLHSIGAGLTVSAFTVMAAYAMRMRRLDEASQEYREYVESAFKFAAYAALISIAVQGFVFGHEMGVAVAHYNPEKFAAIEATTTQVTPLTAIFSGIDRLEALLAYGSPSAPLPSYDGIPSNYCYFAATSQEDAARIGTCQPPLIIHYFYYTKMGVGVLLGLYALLISYYVWRRGPRRVPGWLLGVAPLSIVLVQLVSFLGWAVREVGRKPWTIYGVMTPDVAQTANPASPLTLVLVSAYFLALLGVLGFSVYKFLWVPGRLEVE